MLSRIIFKLIPINPMTRTLLALSSLLLLQPLSNAKAMPHPELLSDSNSDSERISGLHTDVGGSLSGATTWDRAGSPYVSTSDIMVPAGASLTIEPGVEVRMGAGHNLKVAGTLRVLGEADQMVKFRADAAPWGHLEIQSSSSGSVIRAAEFAGGGAPRNPMVILAADVEIDNSSFLAGSGYAMDVISGAAQVRGSTFNAAVSDRVLAPSAAVRIKAGSRPRFSDNYFLSNIYPMHIDAAASPRFQGNRFDYNGFNGILIEGEVSGELILDNLGPRRLAYQIGNPGIDIAPGGSMRIAAGATLRFAGSQTIDVKGKLNVEGSASAPVQMIPLREGNIRAGAWGGLKFLEGSSNESSVEFTEILHGGARNGAITIQKVSPYIAYNTIQNSGTAGIDIQGEGASPNIVGNLIVDAKDEDEGYGILVREDASPNLRFNTLRFNREGVHVQNGANPRIGPHNWFDFNELFGVNNSEFTNCVDATGNDWGSVAGPFDDSDAGDSCGLERNDSDGELVSDHVDYRSFTGLIERPKLTSPRCGQHRTGNMVIEGTAPPSTRVLIFSAGELLGETKAEDGGGPSANFSFTPASPLEPGSYQLHAVAVDGEGEDAPTSGISNPLSFSIDPNALIDPSQLHVSYDLEGTHYVQPFQNESGCTVLRGEGEWVIRPHPAGPGKAMPLTFHLPASCPNGEAPSGNLNFEGQNVALVPGAESGFVEATVEMRSGGPVNLNLSCPNLEVAMNLGNVTVEYEGFIYNIALDTDQRISGAKVTLFARDPGAPAGQEWKLWRGQNYFGQTNPQTTGRTGWYAFYPQPGQYRVKVEADGFESQIFSQEDIGIEPFVQTIGLKPSESRPIFLPLLKAKHP